MTYRKNYDEAAGCGCLFGGLLIWLAWVALIVTFFVVCIKFLISETNENEEGGYAPIVTLEAW